jgi:predicted transcriptional regulator
VLHRPAMMNLPILVGQIIRQHRRKIGLSAEEAARRADLSVKFFREIERGTAVVTLQTVERIADAVAWDVCGFFDDRYDFEE